MPTVGVKTFGCKVNLCDSSALAARLEALGARTAPAGAGNADAFLVNTCAVTERALKKAGQYLRALRRARPAAPVAVFGCGPSYGSGIPPMEGVRLFPRGSEDALVRFLAEALGLAAVHPAAAGGSAAFRSLGRTRAFVKVADGCDGACTYCVIPRLRGPVRSEEPRTVLERVAALAAAGHREIVLTGIHLGRFGADLERPALLGALVRRIAEVPGVLRVRLSSIEALEVGEDLLSLSDLPSFAPHFHLPLQSGDAGVLARMGRPYGPEEFLARVGAVRARFARPGLTTDVIVGFPGETDAAFENTLAVCRAAAFCRIHAFPFSPRETTPAAGFPDRPPVETVRRRIAALLALGRELAHAFRLSRAGDGDRVLVERPARDRAGFLEGWDGTYQRVLVAGSAADVGALVPVRITGTEGDALVAERLG